MSEILIEKNVPIPNTKKTRKIYPFEKMDVKDSFEIKIDAKKDILAQKQKIYVAVWRFCKKNEAIKFTTASTENSIRVWRIQ